MKPHCQGLLRRLVLWPDVAKPTYYVGLVRPEAGTNIDFFGSRRRRGCRRRSGLCFLRDRGRADGLEREHSGSEDHRSRPLRADGSGRRRDRRQETETETGCSGVAEQGRQDPGVDFRDRRQPDAEQHGRFPPVVLGAEPWKAHQHLNFKRKSIRIAFQLSLTPLCRFFHIGSFFIC